MKEKHGALSGQMIKEMIKVGAIKNADEKNVRLSSLDLSISDEIYKVQGIFQPYKGEKVRDILSLMKKSEHELSDPLKKGEKYIAKLNEKLSLPKSVYGFCNPKSTTGRLDVHVRLIADGVPRYDSVTPTGWSGEMWVSIAPKTFPIKISKNQSLNQIRFFNADTSLSGLELDLFNQKTPFLWDSFGKKMSLKDMNVFDKDSSVILTIDCNSSTVGWVSKICDKPLDINKVGFYKRSDYFTPIKNKKGYLYLKKNEFYILSTKEFVKVPPWLACEMTPMDERSGEFRSHYAGFIDPGWGWGKNGKGKGRPLTLEVRPFEDIVVRHGQPIAKVRFEKVAGTIDRSYDDFEDSNYKKQIGPCLAKQFISK